MKKFYILAIIATVMVISSCSSARSGSHGYNAYVAPKTVANSYNELDLEVLPDPISYTIDISTPEGRLKLNKISLKQAEQLALTEAVAKNNCVMIVNPQYTNLMKGKHVLRISVYGFPAVYKRSTKEYVPENNRTRTTIDINRTNTTR